MRSVCGTQGERQSCGAYIRRVSLFEIALFASALVMIIAMYSGGRRPERRRRYVVVGSLIVVGCWASVWWLAHALCCY